MVESGLLFKAFDPRARLCPFCIQILTLELESSMSAAERVIRCCRGEESR